MLRAIVLAARLDFTVDPLVVDAIRRHAPLIGKAAPARLLEEFYKILRSGASERAFHELAEVGLLEHLAPELVRDRGQALWPYTRALDAYRHRFADSPDTLTNPVLLGTLLAPQGFTAGRRPRRFEDGDGAGARAAGDAGTDAARRDVTSSGSVRYWACSDGCGSGGVAADAPRARASRPVSGSADVVRDPRPERRGSRALEGLSRGHGARARRDRRRAPRSVVVAAGRGTSPSTRGTAARREPR